MALSLDAVASISQAVAAEQDHTVRRITVASTSLEANRVELIVTVAQHPFEARRVLLNLDRKERAGFERQLRAKLHQALHPLRPILGLVATHRQE